MARPPFLPHRPSRRVRPPGRPVYDLRHPEGTRSLNPDWKKGFYFIAQKAGLPIILYAIDYEKKLIVSTKTIHPTGDVEKDMREIKLYFKDFKGKIPEKFTIGEV